MTPDLTRRSLITGLVSFIAAPAIVRAGSLMPVKVFDLSIDPNNLTSAQIAVLEGWEKKHNPFVLRYIAGNWKINVVQPPVILHPRRPHSDCG